MRRKKLAAAAMAGLGRVDILVNNAGGSRSFKDLHVSEEAWQEAITLNFHRPRQVADALIDQMVARNWGRIINITGKSEPEHTNGAFCAKAGIHSWAKGLSRMVGKNGVTINCIPPDASTPSKFFATTRPSTASGSPIMKFRWGAMVNQKSWPTWWCFCRHPWRPTLPVQ